MVFAYYLQNSESLTIRFQFCVITQFRFELTIVFLMIKVIFMYQLILELVINLILNRVISTTEISKQNKYNENKYWLFHCGFLIFHNNRINVAAVTQTARPQFPKVYCPESISRFLYEFLGRRIYLLFFVF